MLAIAGGKGGCGKTATTCTIAAALARQGRSPVVVDADVAMPDLTRRVRAAHEPGIDDLAGGRAVDSVVQTDHDLPGVGVVASGSPASLGPALTGLRSKGWPVIVDCPAGAGPDLCAALAACDRALIVSTDTRASFEDATKTAAMARQLGATVPGLLVRRTAPATTGKHRPPQALRAVLDVPWISTVDDHQHDRTKGHQRIEAVAATLFPDDSADPPERRDRPSSRGPTPTDGMSPRGASGPTGPAPRASGSNPAPHSEG